MLKQTLSRLRYNKNLARFSSSVALPSGIAKDLSDWRVNYRESEEFALIGERNKSWWSFHNPEDGLEGLSPANQKFISFPQHFLDKIEKESVKKYIQNSWLFTDVLFSSLQGQAAFYRPPQHKLRHPMIFYYAHPTTFYINKLRVAGILSHGIDDYFERIFEVGVDEMRWDDISTEMKLWPKVSEVTEYRKEAFSLVMKAIDESFGGVKTTSITQEGPLWALMMSVEHEKIHLETSSVLMRELPLHLLKRPAYFPDIHSSIKGKENVDDPMEGIDFPQNKFLSVEGRDVEIGKSLKTPTFGWDNEYGRRKISLKTFEASKYKVSNGEFLQFVKSGGYREKKFWSQQGWGWRVFRNQRCPFFWEPNGPSGSHKYKLRTIFEVVNMPWDAPVLVNFHEASAFCRWKGGGMRLSTEAEYLAIRGDIDYRDDSACTGVDASKENMSLVSSSENAVDALPPNNLGFHDTRGNVWEWQEDEFNPLKGFEVHPYYDDFSSPCFDGEHNMIMGGSFMSCGDAGANIYGRYHFRPHFLQHSGLRVVKPGRLERNVFGEFSGTFLSESKKDFSAVDTSEAEENNTYETDVLLDQYLALHYGQSQSVWHKTLRRFEGFPETALDFTSRTAKLLTSFVSKRKRVLDLGCAVGGSSFALAEDFESVIGADFSKSFISQAQKLKNLDKVSFNVPMEGGLKSEEISADLPSREVKERVEFLVADAMNIHNEGLGKFNAILCSNLLCRLPNPELFLSNIHDMLEKDGVVLFLSPYSWLEEFTPRELWLQKNGKSASENIKEMMGKKGFYRIHQSDQPLVIREHERKYQLIVAEALGFRKTE